MDSQLLGLFLVIAIIGVCWKAGPVFGLWWRTRQAGAPVGLLRTWVLYFRNVPVDDVFEAYAECRQAGADVPLSEIVAHARAGGDPRVAMRAYLDTVATGTEIEFPRVCELEIEDSAES